MTEIEEYLKSNTLGEWMNPTNLKLDKLQAMKSEFANSSPFSHLYIEELLLDEKLEQITVALSEQEFEYRQSDLFSLYQTEDFEHLESDVLVSFRSFLSSHEFVGYMRFLTGIDLTQKIDCLGNIYADTDYLLCHDDELLERQIAFIFYLTDMDASTGGAFHLYNTVNGEPDKVVKSLYPVQNRFFFFKVTRSSFHEVGEVIGEDDVRVSISGWFRND
ncbi:MAG: 2OG-Fe(II) oxygenase family protein [Candidatus Kariarchaeaceae archaeon]|jgi:Rps23 Pro-64 3,4-dihydroxylase Tpa1-like proline 4-hydroxylase